MQEHSYTLPMCSIGRTSYVPSTVANVSIDTHSSSSSSSPQSTNMSNDIETGSESSTSTPELNLLLDKLTEILRFRSGCRRHFALPQQASQSPVSTTTTNLKRLQSSSIEPLHNIADVTSTALDGSSSSSSSSSSSTTATTGAWKSLNIHHKSSIPNRSSHYHHKHHMNISTNIHNCEKKRRLPGLLQRLIDEGNLIKEAVRRLKSQSFSQISKQQQPNIVNTPSTPNSLQIQLNLTSRLTPSSSININIPQQLSDSPTQTTSSPNRGISWFLSSSVFGVNASNTNHSSGSGSPLRSCYSSTTHDRTPMEIGIHDG
ncbi:unnamed protein product [Adineta steineri]|uniref:Uncharacterized protein n=1 Tax=Adineta steineri TaxID=433720 RepID=A0A815U1Z2_9BILA|nr:unnamed protein product [Adineta steineri]CAF1648011.1 unnamed protein product [Adineta steineri]